MTRPIVSPAVATAFLTELATWFELWRDIVGDTPDALTEVVRLIDHLEQQLDALSAENERLRQRLANTRGTIG